MKLIKAFSDYCNSLYDKGERKSLTHNERKKKRKKRKLSNKRK